MSAEYCEWLREFNYATVKLPYEEDELICWDLLPEFVNQCEKIYSPTEWREEEFIKNSDMPRYYDEVCRELDRVIEKHGYKRDGYNYRAIKPNHDTILLVCHYGITSVLLSHLMNCSPYSIWQHTCTAPTAVTTIYTEERKKGIVSMRVNSIGEVCHLLENKEPPSFAARFCECFEDDTDH
jgi:probable phosphoglycerate mutase